METILKETTLSKEVVDDESEESNDVNFEHIECEEVHELFWDGVNGLMKPEYQLYRLKTAIGRVYFRFTDPRNFKGAILYSGATSLADEIPTPEEIIDWKIAKGKYETKRYTWMRTLFGSLSHTVLAQYVMDRTVDLSAIPKRVREYFFANDFYSPEEEIKALGVELQKDVIAFKRWIEDYNVQFIAIELPVYSDSDFTASQIDFWVIMDCYEGKGKNKTKKRVMAIIDYKTTKKGARDEMRYQLHSYKNLLQERFPELDLSNIRLYNLMGKAWRSTNWNGRTKPYLMTDQTDKVDHERYIHYHALSMITRNEKIKRNVSFISGEMSLSDNPLDFVKTKSITNIIVDGDWQGLMGNQEPIFNEAEK